MRLPSPEPRTIRERSRRAKLRTTFYFLLATFFLAAFLFANHVYAYPGGTPEQWEAAIKDPKFNQQSWGNETFKNLLFSITAGGFGGLTQQTAMENNGGAIGMMGNGIAFLYQNPPASGVTYFADIGKKLNLIQPAYAQGQGFEGLNSTGIINIWRGFRNLAYVLFVIVFVAMGLAIMFRMQLSPQTVITIQSSLPRIIIALILVTFSFAIAGLLLDLTKVLTGLTEATFNMIGLPSFGDAFKNLLGNIITGGTIVAAFGGLLVFLGPAGAGLLTISAGMIGAAITILAVFAILRLLWTFLMAYIGILLRIILGPLIIIFNTLPGKQIFWGWFTGLLADASVFVTGYVVWRLGWVLIVTLGGTFGLPVPLPPGFGVFGLLQGLLGLGIIFMIPNIANAVKESINRSTQLGGPAGAGLATTAIREGVIARTTEPAAGATPSFKGRIGRALLLGLGGRQNW
ncbi:hypothetical protein HYZ78_01900 [Candidatus Microgenomates bacterium]|nr:hypothetical protein [Candidatus Microgenomates bacterium]